VVRAENLYNLIDQDPEQAEQDATALAVSARAAGDAAAEALAWRAAAVAVRGRDLAEAVELAGRGLSVAIDTGLDDTRDRILVTLAGIDVFAGRHGEARAALESVIAANRGRARFEALTQLGFLELLAGDHSAAIRRFDRSLPEFGTSGVWAANTLSNRGVTRAYVGDLRGAERDLIAAIDVFESLNAHRAVAEARQNLGWVMDQAGDYVGALQAFTQAEEVLATTPASRGYLLRDRANTLIAVGLAQEAADGARLSAEAFLGAGRLGDATESRAVQAMALLAAGSRAEAAGVAAVAEAEFREQGRPIHADHAALIALKAIPSGSLERAHARSSRELAARLEKTAARLVALDAAITAARIHVAVGDRGRAERLIGGAVDARSGSRHDLRIAYWQVVADLRARSGDRAGVLRAARAGLNVVESSQRLLGSTEARVNVAAGAERLGRAALTAARDGGAAQLFDWMERVRAGSLRFRPVRPDASRTAPDLAALRSLAQEIETAQLEGQESSELLRRQGVLERSLRLGMLEARGGGDVVRLVTSAQLKEVLGSRAMVSYAEIGGRLHAVKVHRRRARAYDLGPAESIQAELDHLRFALLRVATGRVGSSTFDLVKDGAERLDQLLLRPLGGGLDDLVIVPTGRLFTVPWSLLSSAIGRSPVVAPSASLWTSAVRRRRRRGEVVLAAGPDLEHSPAEIRRLAGLHPGARRLTPERATSAALLAAADGAALLHVACHGVFRSDNPLFSNLRLVDGPLAVHELEGLGRAPTTVILSACDSGLAEPRPGNEWMGMATALLTLGTRSLVASVMPVPDAAPTLALMEGVHRGLVRRTPVAAALAGAIAEMPAEPETLASRAAFVCMGS
jgi:tetratricopeptide (TPR) repeat protein